MAVDRQSGLINKAAASSAEVTDADGVCPVWPTGGAVFGEKGYGVDPAKTTLKRSGCHDATLKKNTMQAKNRHQDRRLSAMPSPYEWVFAYDNKRVRYRGLEKVPFQVGIRARDYPINCVNPVIHIILEELMNHGVNNEK